MKKNILLILLFTMLPIVAVFCQQTMEVFGKNRLQYQTFNWKYYESLNFDIYYYDKGVIAYKATEYLEKEFSRITDILGYNPYFKSKLFIYNSIAEMHQSNIGVNSKSHRVGGEAKFVKNYIEVANPGSIMGLKKALVSGLSSLIINDMLFGGSLSEMWKNAYLMNLPPWFTQGAINYLSKGWTIEDDNYIRDLIDNGGVKKLYKLNGKEAAIAGQSMWNFIAKKYGKENISQILNLVRITRSEEKSIAFTLEVSFKRIMLEWEEYYTHMAHQVNKSYKSPSKENSLLTLKPNKHISSLSLNSDASKLAYSINDFEKYQIFIHDIKLGNTIKVMSGGDKIINQKVDETIPLLDWKNDSTLGVIAYRKGSYFLSLYSTTYGSKTSKPLRKLEKINSFSFSSNGRLVALSASRKGKNDIYLLSLSRNKLRRLTNDYFDDTYPFFIPNSNSILFSSNRLNDTLKINEENFELLTENSNLFVFNLDTTRSVLKRLTNTSNYNFSPSAKSIEKVYYLSNQKGITNLFVYHLYDSLSNQISIFSKNIRMYSANPEKNTLAYVALNNQKEQIFLDTHYPFSNTYSSQLTPRKKNQKSSALLPKRLEALKEEYTFPNTAYSKKDTAKNEEKKEEEIQETGLIDTNDYVFDKEVENGEKNKNSFLSNYKRILYSIESKGPFKYTPLLLADNITTSLIIDPIRGPGALLETQINDMLGNHKFLTSAILSLSSLKSGSVYIEYQYLEKIIDFSVRYDRSSWFMREAPDLEQKYIKNTIQFTASYPYSSKIRVSLKPNYTVTKFQDLTPLVFSYNPLKVTTYFGVAAEAVFDNTNVLGQNLIEGTKAKVNLMQNVSLSDKKRNFGKLSFDIRHYQKLYRSLIFASKLYYGNFFGNYKHKFLLGGIDNWLANNKHAQDNPWLPSTHIENENLFFLEHITSLRGYDYNVFYGSNTFLANFELRVSLASMFYTRSVSSSFIRNFQIVGFFDLGSAWTGAPPFSEDNNISLVVIEDASFRAQIQTFKSPWLMGYGVGMRSEVFGYFLKLDLAFPFQDGQVGDSKIYATFGHDF